MFKENMNEMAKRTVHLSPTEKIFGHSYPTSTPKEVLQELLFFRYDLFFVFLVLLLCNERMVSEVPM